MVSQRELDGLGHSSFDKGAENRGRRTRKTTTAGATTTTTAQGDVHRIAEALHTEPPEAVSRPNLAINAENDASSAVASEQQRRGVVEPPEQTHESQNDEASIAPFLRACAVCIDDHPIGEFPRLEGCSDDPTVCRTAWPSG